MTGNHGLAFSVSETGIFIHFIASDGSETQIDALSVLDCASGMTNGPLLHWCYERLEEVRPTEVSDEIRRRLLANIDEIVAAKEVELEEARGAGAYLTGESDLLFDSREWLHRAAEAADASAVLLTKEAFGALLALAKKGAT